MRNNLLTIEEAANYLRISKSYFYILMKKKNVKPDMTIGRRNFFSVEKVNDFITNEMPDSFKIKHTIDPEPFTLRDQFAMAALTGIMAKHESWFSPQERAELAYELADAMMKEREAKS
jgi:excisionase family DNA binding protein